MAGGAAGKVTRTGDDMPDTLKKYMLTREVYRNASVAILVDAFVHTRRYLKSCRADGDGASSGLGPAGESFRGLFFLSHFHSDHYSGITEKWSHGTIYASRATGNVLCWKLGVRRSCVECLDLAVTYIFSLRNGDLVGKEEGRAECGEGCFSVELIPANHCPGAVMFLFRSADFGTILHTGDFRFSSPAVPALSIKHRCWEPDLRSNPVLKSMGNVDVLFLDNTYCQPQFTFPDRAAIFQTVNKELLDMMMECERRLSYSQSQEHMQTKEEGQTVSVAVMVGSYFIGKEIIALSVQENFPSKKSGDGAPAYAPIYVTPERYEAMRQLDYFPERFTPHHMKEPQDIYLGYRMGGNGESGGECTGRFTTCEVKLPVDSEISTSKTAGEMSSDHVAPDSMTGGVKYSLALFLVPLSLTTYSALAPAFGRPVRRRHGKGTAIDGGAADTGDETVSLWGNERVDLKQFDGVLFVNPTGWAAKVSRQKINERVSLLNIPYSEHCCFSELIDFVEFVNPALVVPTVSKEAFVQHESLFAEKAPRLRTRYSNMQPICRLLARASSVDSPETRTQPGDAKQEESIKTEKQRNPFAIGRSLNAEPSKELSSANTCESRKGPECVDVEDEESTASEDTHNRNESGSLPNLVENARNEVVCKEMNIQPERVMSTVCRLGSVTQIRKRGRPHSRKPPSVAATTQATIRRWCQSGYKSSDRANAKEVIDLSSDSE